MVKTNTKITAVVDAVIARLQTSIDASDRDNIIKEMEGSSLVKVLTEVDESRIRTVIDAMSLDGLTSEDDLGAPASVGQQAINIVIGCLLQATPSPTEWRDKNVLRLGSALSRAFRLLETNKELS